MTREEFQTFVFDWRAKFVADIDNITKRVIPDHLPAEVAREPIERRQAEAYDRAKEALEDGHIERLSSIRSDYTASLRAYVQWELDHGVLKVVTPADEIERCAELGWFARYRWNAHETSCLLELLKQSSEHEHIESVGYRSIKTDKREIRRGDFDALRPISMTAEFWRSLGTSEQTIRDAEAMERREAVEAARPFRNSSGPSQSLKGRFGQ